MNLLFQLIVPWLTLLYSVYWVCLISALRIRFYINNAFLTDYRIYKFCEPFLVYHYYILSLSDLCPWVGIFFFRNNTCSLYDQNDQALAKELLPTSNEIYNFGRPSTLHILPKNYILQKVEVMNFKFYVSYPYRQTTHINSWRLLEWLR